MNRTKQIYYELLFRLDQGVYPPESKFPSESQLADEFSVSKVTMNKIVSMLASSGRLTRGVRGAGTFVSSPMLRPKGNIVFLGILSAFSGKILLGMQRECLQSGYFPVVFSPDAGELQPCLRNLNRENTAGIITTSYGLLEPPDEIELFCLDYALPYQASDPRVHFLSSDNYHGGRLLMEEVLKRGHREIAIFSSERFFLRSDAPVAPRVQGFHKALEEAGIFDYEQRTFFAMPQSISDAKIFLKKVRQANPPVTLICADSDNAAEILHKAGHELGFACPGEVALTGFGNVTCLPIATVEQNPELQGCMAARYLIQFHSGSRPEAPVDEMVEPTLVGLEYIPIVR